MPDPAATEALGHALAADAQAGRVLHLRVAFTAQRGKVQRLAGRIVAVDLHVADLRALPRDDLCRANAEAGLVAGGEMILHHRNLRLRAGENDRSGKFTRVLSAEPVNDLHRRRDFRLFRDDDDHCVLQLCMMQRGKFSAAQFCVRRHQQFAQPLAVF